MSQAKERLVVIGNGMAGCRAVEEVLKRDPGRYEVAIFGAEPRVNYNRIMLSPVLAGEKRFDDIIVSTAPEHLSRWVHHDLPHRIEHLGLPVRVVPPEPDTHISEELQQKLPNRWSKLPLGDGGAPGW